MAGKKDNAVVAVISDLTGAQAAQLTKEIIRAKGKYAPNGRGTIASGKKENVGGLLQTGYRKQIAGSKNLNVINRQERGQTRGSKNK